MWRHSHQQANCYLFISNQTEEYMYLLFFMVFRRYVLTAAHCQKVSDPIAQVVLGEHDLNEERDCGKCDPVQKFDININDVTVHEDWIPEKVATNANDIALIRLPRLATTYYEKTRYPQM